MTAPAAPRQSWGETLAVYRHRRVIGMAFLGFSAGLPFLLVFSTLAFWLSDVGLKPSTITYFSWVGLTYSIKFFWAPVVDRVPLPILTRLLGRRRSWMLLAMLGIATGLVLLAFSDPGKNLDTVALFALLIAFSSATQDVALDAYRIEAVARELQGAMAATYQLGYRIALLCAGAGALYIADFASWAAAYGTMAGLTLVGILTVLVIQEPTVTRDPDAHLREERVIDFLARNAHLAPRRKVVTAWFIGAVVCPFTDFFTRKGSVAVVILIFISVFRLSDVTMAAIASKFYFDLGFTKSEVATVIKLFGLAMTILGAFLGGALIARFGIMRPLVLAAAMIAGTTLFFALLAIVGHSLPMLALTISADNITGGLAGSVFIAYLSSLTNSTYTATQYALFSSLMTLPGKIMGGWSGTVAEALGLRFDAANKVLNPQAYGAFFVFVAAIGIPSVILAFYLMRVARAEGRAAVAASQAR